VTRTLRGLIAVAFSIPFVCGVSGCGQNDDSRDEALAIVAGREITRSDVEDFTALYARRETDEKEGGDDGEKGTARVVATLQVLVQQAELELKAKQLGIRVKDREIDERLGRVPPAQRAEQAALRDNVRAQLVYEKLFRTVTAGVRVTMREARRYYEAHKAAYDAPFSKVRATITQALLGLERNRFMKAWLLRVRREFAGRVRYRDGYVPPGVHAETF